MTQSTNSGPGDAAPDAHPDAASPEVPGQDTAGASDAEATEYHGVGRRDPVVGDIDAEETEYHGTGRRSDGDETVGAEDAEVVTDDADQPSVAADMAGDAGPGPSDPGPVAAAAALAAAAAVAAQSDPVETRAEAPARPPIATPEPAPKRRSLAGRVLMLLVLLVAGGALALWGGPKLAPLLPEPLAPLRAWLVPGGDKALAEIAVLRAELTTKINEIPVGPNAEDVRAIVAEGVKGLPETIAAETAKLSDAQKQAETALKEQIGVLADKINASDSAAIETRILQAESEVVRIGALIDTLNGRLSGVASEGGQITEQTASQLAAFRSEVEGMRAGLADMVARIGALSQRVDEAEAASTRRAETARVEAEEAATKADAAMKAAALEAAVVDLGNRVSRGEPYAAVLADVARLTGLPADPVLEASAANGLPTLVALQTAFPDAAHRAIRAGLEEASGEGILGRASRLLSAQVASRSLTEREGTDTDAILSRIEARLKEGAFEAVLTEAAGLTEAAKAPLAGLLAEVERRVAGEKAYAALVASGPKPAQ